MATSARTLTRRAWYGMQYRCDNPTCREYPNYGGRGIKVADRWRDFEAFVADMGLRTRADLSIERKDNNGNYEPGNCVWAPRVIQANNRRSTRWVEWAGSKIPLAILCRQQRVSYGLVTHRLNAGWSITDAVALPAQEMPWERPLMDDRIRERPPTDIELAGYMPSARHDYFAIIHPDGSIIYHFGEDGWHRA